MRLVILMAAAGLAGCAHTVAVKQVVADPSAYLQQFASVPSEAAGRLPKGEPELPFKRLEIDTVSDVTRTDEKGGQRDISAAWVFVNAGRGILNSYTTVSNNGVPFRVNYRVSYRGLRNLKWQTVFLSQGNAELAYEVKAVKSFDSLLTGSGKLEFAYTAGPQTQLTLFPEGRESCTFGATKPASTLHAALEGNATELVCENYGSNGQLASKASFAFLPKYGIVLQTEFSDSANRTTYRFKSVRFS